MYQTKTVLIMTQEHKELLRKDLCGRLPYGIKVEVTNTQGYHHDNVAKKGEKTIDTLKGFDSSYNCFTVYHNNPLDWDWTCNEIDIEDIKPYLFPLSNMTEEQKEELLEITDAIKIDDTGIYYEEGDTLETYLSKIPYTFMCNVVTWCYKNHLDINNLIPLGLANDATGLNIY